MPTHHQSCCCVCGSFTCTACVEDGTQPEYYTLTLADNVANGCEGSCIDNSAVETSWSKYTFAGAAPTGNGTVRLLPGCAGDSRAAATVDTPDTTLELSTDGACATPDATFVGSEITWYLIRNAGVDWWALYGTLVRNPLAENFAVVVFFGVIPTTGRVANGPGGIGFPAANCYGPMEFVNLLPASPCGPWRYGDTLGDLFISTWMLPAGSGGTAIVTPCRLTP